jgi:hypothetical protein
MNALAGTAWWNCIMRPPSTLGLGLRPVEIGFPEATESTQWRDRQRAHIRRCWRGKSRRQGLELLGNVAAGGAKKR